MGASSLDVVIGLGSNLGDRIGQLRLAVAELEKTFEVRAQSAVYETLPVGPPQPDYLNAAVRVLANCTPNALLDVLLGIERGMGRVRARETRWGPRTLDLDVLWAARLVVSSESLTVPHPRLIERPFALLPLLDVAPDAIDPRTKKPFVAPDNPERDAGVRRTTLSL